MARRLAIITGLLLIGASACSSATTPSASSSTASETAVSPSEAPAGDGSLARVQEAGVFKTCAVDGLLPLSSSDPDQPGAEQLIARALADELGVEHEQVWVGTWDGLIPSLQSEECDAIVDGMFITPEREEIVDFAGPYYANAEVIVVQKDNDSIQTLDDLKQVDQVGVLQGSVTVDILEGKGFENLKIYPDQNTIILDLSNGGVDAAYLESSSAGWALEQNPDLNAKIVEGYEPGDDEKFNNGVPVRQEDDDLRVALNDAFAALTASGELQELLAEYGIPYFPPI